MPTTNTTLESISTEKTRIAASLAKLQATLAATPDGQRIAKLRAELTELDAAERVMARFSGRSPANTSKAASPTQKTASGRGRGRPRGPAAGKSTKVKAGTISLHDATAAVIAKNPNGIAPPQIMAALKSEYGMTPRANHVGAALQRHRRAGRLQFHNGSWYPPGMSIAA